MGQVITYLRPREAPLAPQAPQRRNSRASIPTINTPVNEILAAELQLECERKRKQAHFRAWKYKHINNFVIFSMIISAMVTLILGVMGAQESLSVSSREIISIIIAIIGAYMTAVKLFILKVRPEKKALNAEKIAMKYRKITLDLVNIRYRKLPIDQEMRQIQQLFQKCENLSLSLFSSGLHYMNSVSDSDSSSFSPNCHTSTSSSSDEQAKNQRRPSTVDSANQRRSSLAETLNQRRPSTVESTNQRRPSLNVVLTNAQLDRRSSLPLTETQHMNNDQILANINEILIEE